MSSDHYSEFTKLLVDATDIVSESRNKDYGDFVQNHNDIAKIWNVVLKNNLANPILLIKFVCAWQVLKLPDHLLKMV